MAAGTAGRLGTTVVGLGAIIALPGFIGCFPPVASDSPPSLGIDPPQPDSVEAVVLLVGDAGAATLGDSPVLQQLGAEVEYWSERLDRDSAVTVAFLGDNVYPVGIRDRAHPEFPVDSARLMSQVQVLGGTFARSRGATGVFLAGNHDWGNMDGAAGVARLGNQRVMLDSARADGISVFMHPDPGDAGPVVRDVRHDVRLLMIDTHWYLQSGEVESRIGFFERVKDAVASADGRHIIMLAHHPYSSAGPHGLLTPGDRGLGIMYLLQRSGSLVQDLSSAVYTEFRAQLDSAFAEAGRPPLVFAGGHDHSLQVIDGRGPWAPVTSLVSGAGSKLSSVAEHEDLRFSAARPGYMSLVLRWNGAVDLYVATATSSADGPAAVEVVYSERLVAPTHELSGLTDSGGG